MKTGKFHIRCDMEGVTGVVSLRQVTPGSPEYAEARAWFMAELLALLDGLKAGGATNVSVYDEHWFGRNIDLAQLPPGVCAVCGKPPYTPKWRGDVEGSAGMILHGLHSMEGAGHTLSHTYEPEIARIMINGTQVGEIGVETAIAGDCGVPLVLVIADSAGADEARQLVPAVSTVVTKISRGPSGAECFALASNLETIRTAARRVAQERIVGPPWVVPAPVEMLLTFKPGRYRDVLHAGSPADFITSDTLRLAGDSVTDIWCRYWQQKLAVQRQIADAS